MKIAPARHTSGRIALANLSASIDSMERAGPDRLGFDGLETLSSLLFLRGDLLGRIADHDRAEAVARAAVELAPATAAAMLVLARLAERFHRFDEAHALLDGATAEAGSDEKIVATRAALWQATGRFGEALEARSRLARDARNIQTLGALACVLAEMGRWSAAEILYAEALESDENVSPLPCAQLLFEWGVGAMRRGDLPRAEHVFDQLDAVLPGHVPGRGHRAEVALAQGQVDFAEELVTPLLAISDDPEYIGTHAEILAALGDHSGAATEARRAAAAYDALLARRPEAYADHAASFFLAIGKRPLQALELARKNHALRDTPRSRRLLARARQAAEERRLPARVSGCMVVSERVFA